jgi:chromosomal replication initiation ATPase DnaA
MMRLEITDTNSLVRHYSEIRKRLMTVSREIAPPQPAALGVVQAVADLSPQQVTEEVARIASKIVFFPSKTVVDQFRALAIQCGLREPTMALVVWEICEFYKVDRISLISARRTQNIVMPRHVAMFLCRELTTRSLPSIGRFFGGRDHTTVRHAFIKIGALVKTDERLADEIDVIKLRILNGMGAA